MNPTISVIMPVYNCAEYVGRAIKSILNQTFTDFELIIVDDGSTDDTVCQVNQIHDGRLLLYQITGEKTSFGAAGALNLGISKARGKYIARQDGDDYSLSDRLERQAKYLDDNSVCSVVGTGMVLTDGYGEISRFLYHRHFVGLKDLVDNWPCVAHPTVMMRSEVFRDIGNYDETIDYCEDYDLWLRIVEHYGDGSIRNMISADYVKCEHDNTNTAKGKKNGLIKLYNEMALLKSKIRIIKNEI